MGLKFGHLVLVFTLHFSDGILAIIFGVRAGRQSAALLRLVAGHLQYTTLTTIEGPVLERWYSTVGARCRPLCRTVTAAPTDNSRNNLMSSACVDNTLHLTVNTSWHGMSRARLKRKRYIHKFIASYTYQGVPTREGSGNHFWLGLGLFIIRL